MTGSKPDPFITRLVVFTLCMVVLAGAFVFAKDDISRLDDLVKLAVGAIIGILAKTSVDRLANDDPPQDVQVVNAPENPVPVEPGA